MIIVLAASVSLIVGIRMVNNGDNGMGQPAQQDWGGVNAPANGYQQPQYGQPMVGPTEPNGYGYPPVVNNNDHWDGFVIAGFVCSFFIPLIGLILSIVGLHRVNKNGGKSHGMAVAGIIISILLMIVSLVFSVIMWNTMMNMGYGEVIIDPGSTGLSA